MSNQESKSKKELSDKELQKATGGADIDVTGGADAGSIGDVSSVVGWTDEAGVFHEGIMPDATTTGTDVPPPNPEVGFTAYD